MTELSETMREAAQLGTESAGPLPPGPAAPLLTPPPQETPAGSGLSLDVRPPVKPAGRWAVFINYDPEKGTREADLNTKSEDYVKRFQARESFKPEGGEVIRPDFDGVMMEPVFERRKFLRWKPVRVNGLGEARQFFASGAGQRKRLIEQFGLEEFGDRVSTGGVSPTRLIDQEFIPLLAGPFYKQLYLYDYLQMHARAFQLVNHSALAAAAVKIMQRFTIGRGISFHIKDDQAREVWEEFWERNKLRQKLRIMAWDLPWQGELMLRYYEPKRGYMTIRVLDASTCWEVVTDPEDVEEVYYYHFQWPCLRGDVRIACLDGTNPTVEELAGRSATKANPVWVYSYDSATGRVVPGKATRIWRAGRKRCVEVELDNGEKVVASHDHPFLMRDGRYVWAERLKPDDSLMPLYRRSGYEEVWHPGQGAWECTHRAVARDAHGLRPKGQVTHHLDENRADNRPGNLAYLPKPVHDAETSARRWANPDLAGQRDEWTRKMSRAVKQAWRKGAYEHRVGKGSRPASGAKIAAGMKKAWARPGTRAKMVATLERAWASPRRNARIAKAARTRTRNAVGQFQSQNHKVVSVRPAGTHAVYDLQVERYHNFALTAGVFTHNTPYQIWVTGTIPVSKYIVQQVPPTNVQHVKINHSAQERRGRSSLLPGMSWLKRVEDFFNGQTVKALLEANLVWKIKVKGDQADVDAFLSNPAFTELPPPGGMWIENEAVDLTVQSATMTASRGATGIGQQLANMFATSLNLPSEYFNIEGAAASRATALVRTDPAVKAIEDMQQLFKEEILGDMYDRVITAALLAGRITRQAARREPDLGPGDDRAEPLLLPPGAGLPTQRAELVRLR